MSCFIETVDLVVLRRSSMFKCPNCGASVSNKEKSKLRPSKHMPCKQCAQVLKPFTIYYYSLFFIAPFTVSISMNYAGFSTLGAMVLSFTLFYVLLVCQPIKKVTQ